MIEKFITKISTMLSMRGPVISAPIPAPLILASRNRSGLSPIRMATSVLAKKKELGLSVGSYEDGSVNENDLVILAIFESLVAELQTNAKFTIALDPGQQVVVAGGNAGGPFTAYGSTITIGSGCAIVQ